MSAEEKHQPTLEEIEAEARRQGVRKLAHSIVGMCRFWNERHAERTGIWFTVRKVKREQKEQR